VPPTVVVVDEVGELQLDRNADSMEKDKTPSKRSVNESRALMPGKNKRVKQTIAEYAEKKSPSVNSKKRKKNDITSELGESIESIILVSGKQRNEEMKETVRHNSVMESIEKEKLVVEREKAASAKWTEKKEEFSYRSQLFDKYNELRSQNHDYSYIAQIFPDMIVFFPKHVQESLSDD